MVTSSAPTIRSDPPPDWADLAEQRLLNEAVRLAERFVWNDALVVRAGEEAGLSAADVALLAPHGPADLVALLSRRHDRSTLVRLGPLEIAALKVRERIRLGVQTRLDVAMADETAVRRASLCVARPDRVGLAASLAWETADGLWRWAGDTATDENHYSKRAILAGLLTSTLGVRLAAGPTRAADYLAARIDNVMAFERWKAGLASPVDALSQAAGWLGGLRYGRRPTAAPASERQNGHRSA